MQMTEVHSSNSSEGVHSGCFTSKQPRNCPDSRFQINSVGIATLISNPHTSLLSVSHETKLLPIFPHVTSICLALFTDIFFFFFPVKSLFGEKFKHFTYFSLLLHILVQNV